MTRLIHMNPRVTADHMKGLVEAFNNKIESPDEMLDLVSAGDAEVSVSGSAQGIKHFVETFPSVFEPVA